MGAWGKAAAFCLAATVAAIVYGLVGSNTLPVLEERLAASILSKEEVRIIGSRGKLEGNGGNEELAWDGEDLTWFVHVSDLHLSKFNAKRTERFERFLEEGLEAISPAFVLVTGDLVDSKHTDKIRSEQFPEEWATYKRLLSEHGWWHPEKWIDLRGNHDCFGVGSNWDLPENLFSEWSVTGSHFHGPVREFSFYDEEIADVSLVDVVTLDACPIVGAKTPLNFFGRMSREQLDRLERELREKSASDAPLIVMGHYPLSTILSDRSTSGRTVQEIVREENVVAYLCGHLHTMFDRVPRLHARHFPPLLELEVGDFKITKRYRAMALDNGILSSVEATVDSWPLTLITTPKHSSYLSEREPHHRAILSPSIRFLSFSPATLTSVTVEIDGSLLCDMRSLARLSRDDPFFECPWNAVDFANGIHTITITAKDSEGRTSLTEQPFSLDGSSGSLDFLPALLLSGRVDVVASCLYLTIAFSALTILFSLAKLGFSPVSDLSFTSAILWWTWAGPLLLPWFLGFLSRPDHMGVVTLYGVWYLWSEDNPMSMGMQTTFFYRTLDTIIWAGRMLPFQATFTLAVFVTHLSRRGPGSLRAQAVSPWRYAWALADMLMVALFYRLVWSAALGCRYTYLTYGLTAVLVSPMSSWYYVSASVWMLVTLKNRVLGGSSKPRERTQ